MIKSQQRFQFTLQGVRHEANIGMAIHTLVLTSDSSSCNCNSIHLLCVNWLQRTSHPFSCLFRRVYINQCKCHMSCLIPRSSSTCTACTTTYYRFFNVWNKLLKYICVCFIRNISNIQQTPSWAIQIWSALQCLKHLSNHVVSNCCFRYRPCQPTLDRAPM